MPDEPQVRRAVRVVLMDRSGCVLLLEGHDPSAEDGATWWITPGGGREPGESPEAAAIREVAEETGLTLSGVGPPVWRRRARLSFMGQEVVQEEDFYVVEVDRFDVDRRGWTEVERQVITGWRWWSPEALQSSGAGAARSSEGGGSGQSPASEDHPAGRVYPVGLSEHLERWRREGIADPPRAIT